MQRITKVISIWIIALAATGSIASAQDAEFRPFAANSPESSAVVDHDLLGVYLERLGVLEKGRLKIAHSVGGERGAALLDAYVAGLSAISPQILNRNEQLAYWLNMRNALILSELAKQGGRGSLETLRGSPAAPGAGWTAKRTIVDGASLSIDDIEQRIILRNWADPLVLYGLYQASASGPALDQRPYSGSTVWASLQAGAAQFVRSSGVRIRSDRIEAAAVFNWYKAPLFEGSDVVVRTQLERFIAAKDQARFREASEFAYQPFKYQIERYEPRGVSRNDLPGTSYPTGS